MAVQYQNIAMMQSRSSSLSRSRSKSITASNPNILSLSAYEQIFESPIFAASPSIRSQKALSSIACPLEPCQPQPAALNIASPLPCLLEPPSRPCAAPCLPLPRKIKTLGTQTARTLLTEAVWREIDQDAQRIRKQEKELADLKEGIQRQLDRLSKDRKDLEEHRKEVDRDKQKLRQADKDVKARQAKLEKQALELDMIRIGTLVKKIAKIQKAIKLCAFQKLEQCKKQTPPSTRINSYKQSPLVSPTSTPNPRSKPSMEVNRPLDFSFKDHRPSVPMVPLGCSNDNCNRSGKLLQRRRAAQLEEATRQRVMSGTEASSGEAGKKLLSRKGINYPLNYKK